MSIEEAVERIDKDNRVAMVIRPTSHSNYSAVDPRGAYKFPNKLTHDNMFVGDVISAAEALEGLTFCYCAACKEMVLRQYLNGENTGQYDSYAKGMP